MRRAAPCATAGLPLEITFAPTRLNIHEAGAVIERARALGAFRFNTGRLMRIGTAARLWDKLEPTARQYGDFRRLLARLAARFEGELELCHEPFDVEAGLRESLASRPATLLVLPNGWVKVAAALPRRLCRFAPRLGWRRPGRPTATHGGVIHFVASARCAISDPSAPCARQHLAVDVRRQRVT